MVSVQQCTFKMENIHKTIPVWIWKPRVILFFFIVIDCCQMTSEDCMYIFTKTNNLLSIWLAYRHHLASCYLISKHFQYSYQSEKYIYQIYIISIFQILISLAPVTVGRRMLCTELMCRLIQPGGGCDGSVYPWL